MRQRPAGRHVVAPAEEELVAAGHALGGVNVAGDGAGVLRLGVGAAGPHVVAGALGTISVDDVVAGRALRIGDVVGPGVGVGVADRLRAAGQGVVAVASDDGVVAGLGAVVAGRVVGVGVGVVGDIQRVAGTQVVAFAGIDVVAARDAVLIGDVRGVGRRLDRHAVGLDGQGVAGEAVVAFAGGDGVVAGRAVVAGRVVGLSVGVAEIGRASCRERVCQYG